MQEKLIDEILEEQIFSFYGFWDVSLLSSRRNEGTLGVLLELKKAVEDMKKLPQ